MSRLMEVTASLQRRGEQADHIADIAAGHGGRLSAHYWRENARRYYRAAARTAAPDERLGVPGRPYPCDAAPRASGHARGLAAVFVAGMLIASFALIAAVSM